MQQIKKKIITQYTMVIKIQNGIIETLKYFVDKIERISKSDTYKKNTKNLIFFDNFLKFVLSIQNFIPLE